MVEISNFDPINITFLIHPLEAIRKIIAHHTRYLLCAIFAIETLININFYYLCHVYFYGKQYDKLLREL